MSELSTCPCRGSRLVGLWCWPSETRLTLSRQHRVSARGSFVHGIELTGLHQLAALMVDLRIDMDRLRTRPTWLEATRMVRLASMGCPSFLLNWTQKVKLKLSRNPRLALTTHPENCEANRRCWMSRYAHTSECHSNCYSSVGRGETLLFQCVSMSCCGHRHIPPSLSHHQDGDWVLR